MIPVFRIKLAKLASCSPDEYQSVQASEHTNPKFHAGEDPDDVLTSKAQSGNKDAFDSPAIPAESMLI